MSESPHSASNSIIVRLKLSNEVGVLARITNTISEMGGNIGAIDLVRPEAGSLVRDISILTRNRSGAQKGS